MDRSLRILLEDRRKGAMADLLGLCLAAGRMARLIIVAVVTIMATILKVEGRIARNNFKQMAGQWDLAGIQNYD